MGSFNRTPEQLVIAGSRTDDTAKVDLTASYAAVGSGLNVWRRNDISAHLREHAGVEALTAKFFAKPDGGQPTVSTGLYQLVNPAGAEIEVIVPISGRTVYPLNGLATKWLLTEARGNVGTNGDLSAFILANSITGGRGKSSIVVPKTSIIAVATNLTGSYADVGAIIDIRGMGNISLFVENTGNITADIQVYVQRKNVAPSGTTGLQAYTGVAGTTLTFSTLTTEKAVHPLPGLSGNFLALQAKGTGAGTATVTIFMMATVPGV